jgi:putative effector of murein hydrolase LrgA (UPF0299 family)
VLFASSVAPHGRRSISSRMQLRRLHPESRNTMPLQGLTWLIALYLLGTLLSRTVLPVLPGAILGLLLLFAWLAMRGRVDASLERAANGLLGYLPLLLVVPAAGIMTSGPLLAADWPAIAAALVVSLLVTVPFCGWLFQWLVRRQGERR